MLRVFCPQFYFTYCKNWNELCESAYSKKGKIREFLSDHRSGLAHFFEMCMIVWIVLIIAIILKLSVNGGIFVVSNEMIMYAILGSIPLRGVIQFISHGAGRWIFESFGNLMELHIFKISTGDMKKQQKIEKNSSFWKEIATFILNTTVSVALSIIFWII